MKSPFSIFRKHQKAAMAVLGILVIFAFVIGDTLQNMAGGPMSTPLRAMIFAVFGASTLGLIGYIRGQGKGSRGKGGKAKDYAITGAILGVLVGVITPQFFAKPPAFESAAGNLTDQQLQELTQRKQIANQFLELAFYESLPDQLRMLAQNPQFRSSFQGQLDAFLFQGNASLTYLMSHEADTQEMGITVSKQAINNYIRQLTQRPDMADPSKTHSLNETQFREILKRMRISPKTLYDALRYEIKAKMALELIAPPQLVTPQQYWNNYQKLNVRQELEAVAVRVEDFTKEMTAPSEAELKAFFSDHRKNYPNQNSPGEPGFFQPQRIRLEYVEADYELAEAEILEQVKADFLTNDDRIAELQKIDDAMSEVRKTIQDGSIKKENEKEELEKVKRKDLRKLLESGTKINRFDFEIALHYEDNKETRYKNRVLPAEPFNSESFGKAPFFNEPESSAPETKKGNSDSDDAQEKKSPDAEKAAPEKKNSQPDEKQKESENGGASLDPKNGLLQTVSFLDDAAEKKAAPENKAAPKAAPRKGPAPPALPQDPPPPRYRPFDDTMRKDIHTELIGQKSTELIQSRISKVSGFMNKLVEETYYEQLDRLRGLDREQDEESMTDDEANQLRNKISAEIKQFAQENALNYGTTDLLSYVEFSEQEIQERYPIVSARIPNTSPLSRATILDLLFSGRSEGLFSARKAEAGQGNRFAYWKINERDAHTPKELNEPGLRERVEKSWKMLKARPLAEKKAEELAKIVREKKGDMAEALKDAMIAENPVTVQPTESFSWMETGLSDPSNSFAPQNVKLWDLQTIENAGNEFMKTVFESLQEGETGVSANFDKTIYYVVKVRNRSTSIPGSMEALRVNFRDTNLNTQIYQSLLQGDRQKSINSWRERFFEKKYQVKQSTPE